LKFWEKKGKGPKTKGKTEWWRIREKRKNKKEKIMYGKRKKGDWGGDSKDGLDLTQFNFWTSPKTSNCLTMQY